MVPDFSAHPGTVGFVADTRSTVLSPACQDIMQVIKATSFHVKYHEALGFLIGSGTFENHAVPT
jgi:hypothetical protein